MNVLIIRGHLRLLMGKKLHRADKIESNNTVRFHPRNEAQKYLQTSIRQNSITLVTGPAGTGKTGLSIQTLIDMYKDRYLEKIVIVRLITDTFDEHLGALPGEKEEKLYHFLGPILDNLLQILTPGEVEYFISKKLIEVIPVSHLRGRSLVNAGVLVEEAQNMTPAMLLTLLTRIGTGSRIVINGDPEQADFYNRNGISYALKLLDGLQDVGIIKFTDIHIERHPIIKEILARARQLD
jgi:phosphate starvation-inducible PhoH-like protein